MRRPTRGTVLEFEIPAALLESQLAATTGTTSSECQVCRTAFCPAQKCKRSLTHMQCCGAAICCVCLVKIAFQCRCTPHCRQVVAHCPFCREVAAITALDVYRGLSKKRTCPHCAEGDS